MKYLFYTVVLLTLTGCSQCSSSGRRQSRSSQQPMVARQETNTPISDAPVVSMPSSSSSNTDIVDIVAQAEKCVFTIYVEKNGETGSGTGFFVNNTGIAISNYHVFDHNSKGIIEMTDKRRYNIKSILEASEVYDYVVFQVEAPDTYFEYLKIAPSVPRKGESIFILGNPRLLESTLTTGIVSAIRPQNNIDDLIQIDAAISPGSSGSPVMNNRGEVVGIATFKRTDCENCNFAYNIQRVSKFN